MVKRVAIVGAGPSGLPAIRHALLYGCEPVCFEASDRVGGLWNYKPGDSEEASVMKSTVINSSKEMSAYSDFPPKPEVANYMHNKRLLEYFCDYATHYDLIKHVKFNHKVQNVTKSEDHSATGKWDVHYTDEKGAEHVTSFDGVLIATGHHKTPHWPAEWAGQKEFKGRVLHSHDFKETAGFEDKRIVCVGIGNSGGDIAVELSRVTEQLFLSTRRGSWICSRMYDYGTPIDVALNTRFKHSVIMKHIPRAIRSWGFEKKLNLKFDHAAFGMKPKHDVFGAHLTTNDELPMRIISGTVVVKPNIKEFSGNDVIFEDGSVAKDVDVVVCSTGYAITFPIIENGNLIKVEDNQVELYKFMYPLDQKHNTLAVLGLVQPLGSIMPIAEMQTRLFFAALTRDATLPSIDEMRRDVMEKREAMREQFYGSPRHTIQVVYMDFMDELASMIGCRPQFWRQFFSDPKLALQTTFGPCAPYVYRLNGPHKWEGARDAVLQLPARVKKGLNPNLATPTNCTSCAVKKMILLSLVVLLLVYFFM